MKLSFRFDPEARAVGCADEFALQDLQAERITLIRPLGDDEEIAINRRDRRASRRGQGLDLFN